MKKTVKIFYISPEVSPFTRTYRLADVAGSFPKALKDMGHDIRVIMPNYKQVNARKYVLRDVIRLKDMAIPIKGEDIQVSAKSAFLPNSKLQIYFLDRKETFGRDGIYTDPQTGDDYSDNDERFMIFAMGCIETLRMLHWQPDIIHCNDWPSAFLPAYLKNILADDPFFKNTKIAFSIYDFEKDAYIKSRTLEKAGLPIEKISAGETKINGKIDLLHSALVHSDIIFLEEKNQAGHTETETSISPNIEKILAEQSAKICELGSGIDNSVWEPSSDRLLEENYDLDSISKKEANKNALLAKLELESNGRTPLLYTTANGSTNQSIESLLDSIDGIMSLGVNFIFLGVDIDSNAEKLAAINKKYPKNFLFKHEFDEKLTHHLMAGADIYLASAWEEPMISDHLIGLKYGTIPIVKAGEGFDETVKDYTKSSKNGTGFVYNEAASGAGAVVDTVKTATEVYRDASKWEGLIKNAMRQDYSWHSVGPEYIQLLSTIL